MGISRRKSKRWRQSRKLAQKKAIETINPSLGKDSRKVVRYAVDNGTLYKFYDDGGREAVTRGNHLR